MKSIMQDKKECFVSRLLYDTEVLNNLEEHHIYFGRNRRKSEANGLKVWLTYEYHRGTNGVHGKNGSSLDKELKQIGQSKFDELNGKGEFEKIFGRNYIKE